MVEFQTQNVLVSETPQQVNVTAHEWIRVGNLAQSETTFYIAGNLTSCNPQHGYPIPPGGSFEWTVKNAGGNHSFYLCANESFDDQLASLAVR